MEEMREFESGATRSSDEGKLDYEGFLNPAVLRRYAQYLHKHRVQADGQLRDSDNWQQGMPEGVYMKSLARHFMSVWLQHRGYDEDENNLAEALCGVIFNAMGYLHEVLEEEEGALRVGFGAQAEPTTCRNCS
jgi:hypothetical protein